MNFYSIRDLQTDAKAICESICANGEAIITDNGKPTVLMLNISEDDFELVLRAVRQAKAMIAFNSMRTIAAENGYMDDDEIETEISAAHRERRERQKSISGYFHR